MLALAFALALTAAPARAAALRIDAYGQDGKKLSARDFLAHIAPESRRNGGATTQESAIFVTDLDDNPVEGRPWLVSGSTDIVLAWTGAARVKVSLPWPIREDGFSTVFLDKEGAGYADGDSIPLDEEIAATQYRLFRDSLRRRRTSWEPAYRPGGQARRLAEAVQDAMAEAKKLQEPYERAQAYEKALTKLSAAWEKMLFEHGSQAAGHPKLGPAMRWGLTLDETLAGRIPEREWIVKQVAGSGANWVRLVFRLNPDDFLYASPRSFTEYDAVVAELIGNKIHVMGSILDSALWPKGMEPQALVVRARNLALHYQNSIRSWEVASEPDGNWLGGYKTPLPEETIVRAVKDAAAEVKRIDKSFETVATLYWWEGTAFDDAHPTFVWLKRNLPKGVLADIDLVGLSVYPDEHPMGLAFDPVLQKLNRYLPDKRLMVGGFGYVEGKTLTGYWWLDPADLDGARKDLVFLYAGAACAAPRSVGGGFWWPTLTTMLKAGRDEDGLFKIYRRSLQRLGR